jgi:formate dehydrogenase major subunit
MNLDLSRRQFLAGTGAGLAGTTLGALGFGDVEIAYAAAIRPFKLAGTTETRSTCTYCSVACGVILYSKGSLSRGEKAEITHIEGDADHPTNRGTLCPKGAALLGFVHAETRLKYPMIRKPGSNKFERVSWDEALDRVARLMKDDRDKNFIQKNNEGVTVNRWLTTGFLAASAATNETAWATYKIVRSAGMLAFDNQARVCHGPTVAGLGPTFGRGAMTNSWTDVRNTDLVIIMGSNAAEAHPCGFKWVTEAKANRGAKLVVVDPRYTRSAAVADVYAPIRPGTDIAFLLGLINYCIWNFKVQWDYTKAFTNASYIVKEGFTYEDGLFTGYDEAKRDYDRSTWDYDIGPDGYVVSDNTLQNPRCVWNLLKQHVAQYTPEMVERICGTPKDKFLKVAAMVGECSAKDKTMTSMYALGWAQHSKGSQNIRAMAILQLILGNIGVRGGGMNALGGHSNIQGLTDLGLMSNMIPGYLTLPTEKEASLDTYMSTRGFKPLKPDQTSYWQNYKKFFVSFQKSMWGATATAENNFAYDNLPKLDVPQYDILRVFELMYQGKMNGYFCQGFNPLLSFPNRKKCTTALSKLKYLVVMDPLDTETARFWENHGGHNDVDTASIQTEVIQLPSTCFAENEGSLANSGRWLQWHWAGGTPPGEAKGDIWIMAQLHQRLKALYQKEGGAYADPILNLTWDYKDPNEPTPSELAREINGSVLEDVPDPNDPARFLLRKDRQVASFAALRDDGKTACACWIYSGCFNEAGNNMARRDSTDPDHTGAYSKWAFSWPGNRRILYNRASADLAGKAWDPARKLIEWDGAKWSGYDVPDIAPNAKPDIVGPFVMNAEGTARLFARGLMRDGPFPVHYEPFESPIDNPIAPKIRGNPVARVFKGDMEQFGGTNDFPHAATSYRLSEHFNFWTKHVQINASLQPEFFVEIGEELAKEKGIRSGHWVRVWSSRGSVQAKVVVTKRIAPLTCDGKTVHIVGIPLHWGFTGVAKKGFGPNSLTPYVGDANTETPEYKAFLVDIEPIVGPVS